MRSGSAGVAQAAPARSAIRIIRSIGLPVWILIGAAAGIAAGVAFGERAAILRPVGSAYAMMLQVAVYPYLLCSLLWGLGRLKPAMARRLFAASWGVYLFMWTATFAGIWLLSRAIPPPPPPTVLTPLSAHADAAFLDLLIPSNVFDALGHNYVPAVVVFAIVYGVAIQAIENKSALFEILEAIKIASVTIWGWIVRVAPIGVFALFAGAAGTIQPDRMGGLLLYVGLFLSGTFLLAFVVLPAVLAAVAPVGYREILRELRPAFVLALVTTLSVVALPFVQKAAEDVAARAGCPEGEERTDIIQASLSLSYVLAQLGNYFLYLLILYAAYLHHARLTAAEQLLLPFWTLLSGFGSPTATVDGVAFLASWLRLPPDVLDLFLETWTVTRYGQVALSVMGFGFATTLIPLVYFRRLRPRPARLSASLAAAVGLLAATAASGLGLRPALLPQPTNALLPLTLDPQLANGLVVTLRREPAAGGGDGGRAPSLQAIQESGVLRVGYNPNVIPFSYWNDKGGLVGYDISYAYRLARDLNVRLELIPFAWQELADDLIRRRFDVAMAGIYVTDDRLRTLTVSHSYYQSPVALIVPSASASGFLSHSAILTMPKLRLAVFDDPVLVPMLKRLFPNAAIEIVPNYSVLPRIADRIDGAIWSLEQAGAWAAAHAGFTAVQPDDIGSPILLAYLLPPGAEDFRQYLDQWLELKASDGFRAAQLDYWIKLKPRAERRPRWNLLDWLLAVRARSDQGRQASKNAARLQ
jgi:Na+/H+-dicarboxylate symporter/ABC-type amino acid transport substrate-binding protein